MTITEEKRPFATVATNSRDGRRADMFVLFALTLIPLILLRSHVLGLRTYLGNPDRLNNNLKVLKHYVDSFEAGRLAAWNGLEMMGYDSFTLPYTYPNPIAWLLHGLGPEQFYIAAGFVSIGLLACAGIAAYFALRELSDDRFAAFTGAVVYQLSGLSVLKASQNDMSFAVFIMIPVLILAIRRLNTRTATLGYVFLAVMLVVMLHFMFLQKVAYAIMLAGAYAAYRSRAARSCVPAVTLGAAVAAGVALASPRLGGIALTMSQYVRRVPGTDLSAFEAIYEYQNIRPYEILRWFEGTIFGRSQSEAATFGNNVNLSEGFLLFAGCAATIAAIVVLMRYRGRWFGLLRKGAGDVRFFVSVLAFAIAVVVWKPALWLIYELFLHFDFTHARILIVGLLPFSLLVALAVERVRAPLSAEYWNARGVMLFALAMVSALLVARGLILAAAHWKEFTEPVMDPKIKLREAAIAHFALTAIVMAGFWCLSRGRMFGKTTTMFSANLFAGLIVAQALAFANYEVNSAGARNATVPFPGGDFYSAPRSDFIPPLPAERAILQDRLHSERFRTVVICDSATGGGMCAAHIGNFWKIRLADGYYGLGVPARIAMLPWPQGFSLRSITFVDARDLPWKSLALLNVNQALTIDYAVYANSPQSDGARDVTELANRLHVLQNPLSPVPRVFFAKSVQMVTSAEEAARVIADEAVTAAGVVEKSYVEGFESAAGLAGGADIQLAEGGDWLQAEFPPVSGPRFLVFNELYYPGWQATVNGVAANVIATNAVMRGVPVPAGATNVRLEYTTFSRSRVANGLYLIGALVFFAGFWAVRAAILHESRRARGGL